MTAAEPVLPAPPAAARPGAPATLALLQRWVPSVPPAPRRPPVDARASWLSAWRHWWGARRQRSMPR